MVEESRDAVVRPETVRVRVHLPTPQISMRNYFSTHLLLATRDFAARASAIESAHAGDSRFDVEHRGYVLVAVTSAVAFLEAMINELFQDTHDGHQTAGDGYLAPLSKETQERMASAWASGGDRDSVLDKYQQALDAASAPSMNKGKEPYQSARLLVRLRNHIIHYKSESVSAGVNHQLAESLSGKFRDNLLMEGSGNPWWPDHALGAGCAQWSYSSAKALADKVADISDVIPNYQRHSETWFADES